MSVSFNLLDQPWIPVVTADGEATSLGIRDVIMKAHELREISCVSPLEEYSLYRFLGLFLMDMLRPESESDIEDLLSNGLFETNACDAYIAQCRSEGVTFDLFDADRPFLQSRFDPTMDGAPKPASILDCTRASGNNHAHFDHGSGKDFALSPAEAARLILATYLFCTAAAQGYPSGVNASPPYYGVIQGKNLYETLVYTLLPTDTISLPLDDPPVLWRRTDPVIPKREIGKTSWLQGMLFPARRIHLIPEEDGSVKSVHLCQGENFVNKTSWRDPYVSYRIGKDGLFPMRPSADRAIWRNISDIVNIPGGQASQLLAQYRSVQMSAYAELVLYGVETSQASYLGIYRHTLRFPMNLTANDSIVSMLQLSVNASELAAAALRRALTQVKSIPDSLASQAVQQYYLECEKQFWALCEKASDSDPGKEDYNVFCDAAVTCARKIFDAAVSELSLRASALAAVAKERENMNKSLWKIRKEARI